jgi:hypothetical protein
VDATAPVTPVFRGALAPGVVGLPVTTVEEPPAAETMEEAMDEAAVIGQTVVVRAIVSVITPAPAEDLAGQSVIDAAQLVTVRTTVWKTVKVVCVSAFAEALNWRR